MNDYSIDCETLGTAYDAPVIAIGVQHFDRDTGKMGGTFHKLIDIESALRSGRISGETLQWWMMQSDAARQMFSPAKDIERTHLSIALADLAAWMRSRDGSVAVWGNGATQDITWLEHAFRNGSVGLKVPWHYRSIRDMRTLTEIARYESNEVKFVGVAHNALDDATHQAKVIHHCFKKLGLTKAPAAAKKQTPKPPVEDEEEL